MNEGLLCDYPMSYGEEPTLRHSPYYAIVDQEYVDKMRDEGLYEYLTKRGANHDNWFIGSYYKQRGALKSLDSDLEEGIHEGCIEQINRLMTTSLYGDKVALDDNQRIRMDDWELRDDIQQACRDLWPLITTENLAQETDYAGYKQEFLNLFGFGLDGVDYDADVATEVNFDVIELA